MPKLYDELAVWWPLMSAVADYEEEAAFYYGTMSQASKAPLRSLLELGSGGGNNASFMKRHFEDVVLVDVSEGMLAHSREINPECQHLQGDMRSVRLNRQFDAVFIHDAICYMTSAQDLRRAIETAQVHCRPGGVALLAPDHVKEHFRPSTDHGGEDGAQRALRYLEWSWDPNPGDETCVTDYVYALRDVDGSVTIEHDRHIEGLFARADWLRFLAEAGFEPRVVTFDHSEIEPGTYELFVCAKPA